MSYQEKKEVVFKQESKAIALYFFGIAVVFLVMLILGNASVGKPVFIGVVVVILLVLWFVVRKTTKHILCTTCSYDLRETISILGRASDSGFCPKCGNEIK